MFRFDDKTLWSKNALVLFSSFALHALALSLVSTPQNKSPSFQKTSPLRFSGNTFDIEALTELKSSETPARANSPHISRSDDTNSENKAPDAPSTEKTSAPPARVPGSVKVLPPVETSQSAVHSRITNEPQQKLDQSVLPSSEETAKNEDSAPNESTSPRSSESRTPPSSTTSSRLTKATGDRGSTYGQGDVSAKTTDLLSAYLKTLPLAAKLDPTWTGLPFGSAGAIEITLSLNDRFKLAPVQVHETRSRPAPPHLKRMAQKNRAWLLSGRFALRSKTPGEAQRLRIEATISQKQPDPESPQARGTRALGTRGGAEPSGAYFTYFSGRHVELRVTPLN